MDAKLIALARAVKARQHLPGPTLWLMSDRDRLPDPGPVLQRLPRRLAGVVMREAPPALVERVGRICQARGFVLLLAGRRLAFPPGLPFRQRGRHFSRGWVRQRPAAGAWWTSSAHDAAEAVRALRGRVRAVFLSPLFPTASHPGAPALGLLRFLRLCRLLEAKQAQAGRGVIALGGLDGESARRLGRAPVAGFAAIGAFAGPVREPPWGRRWQKGRISPKR
jgi:thiamine-phosphate pyrophosphorylase